MEDKEKPSDCDTKLNAPWSATNQRQIRRDIEKPRVPFFYNMFAYV